jgi:hypothetical protein
MIDLCYVKVRSIVCLVGSQPWSKTEFLRGILEMLRCRYGTSNHSNHFAVSTECQEDFFQPRQVS